MYINLIKIGIMNEITIIIIGVVLLFGGVIIYAVISTATGLEEDKNKNYIPDWIEKKFPKIFKSGKDLE
ncbi:MAG: hypothetical protein ACI9TK_001127 [Flavobacteriaceae bacterium]